jgi:hypothetical protein
MAHGITNLATFKQLGMFVTAADKIFVTGLPSYQQYLL